MAGNSRTSTVEPLNFDMVKFLLPDLQNVAELTTTAILSLDLSKDWTNSTVMLSTSS